MKIHNKGAVAVNLLQTLHGRKMFLLMMLGFLLLLTACGGGAGTDNAVGSDDIANDMDSGELVLALTDAEGDFLSYVVDITSIKLTRLNGAVVEALPLTTTVDFAQYVELSELLSIATVPVGVYDTVEVNLDYSSAHVTVQDEQGEAIEASLVDSDGEALTVFSVSIELSTGSRFTIAPGIPAQVTLDLDLDASNEVVIDDGEAVVTVSPVLLVDSFLETPKPFRLRGLLNTVAIDEDVFSIDLLPFTQRQRNFGSARVNVDDETRYEIDGVSYTADDGLTQLATMPEDTPIVSLNDWNIDDRSFTANAVYAGSSVPWGDNDGLTGVVVARTDNSLTVRGAMFELSDGEYRFYNEATVTVGAETVVTQQLQGFGNASIGDISIGSSIAVVGEIVDDTTIDATAGKVRIVLSNAVGSVVSVSPLSVDLQRLSARNIDIFDFSGTGTDTSSDAAPEYYEIDSGELQLNSLLIGDPIKVRGLVSAFGTAPEDFIAQTVLDAGDVKGRMIIGYGEEGSDIALAQISEQGFQFDLTEVTGRSFILRAGITTQLMDLDVQPIVIPAAELGVYAITGNARIAIYREFAAFIAELEDLLAEGNVVTVFDGQGYYDNQLNQFSSSRLRVGITQPLSL